MSSETEYRERVYDIFAEESASMREKTEAALEIGTEYLDVSAGLLNRIDDGQQRTVCVADTAGEFTVGATCPLDESYCRRTVEEDGVLSVQSASDDDLIPDRAVDRFGVESYIGAKVYADDALFGTVCFVQERATAEPFSESDELFVELLARLIGERIARSRYQAELNRRADQLRAEKRRFEDIADASSDIIFRIDAEAEFTYLSAATERLLGYRPETLVGNSFTTILSDDATQTALEMYSQVIGGERVTGAELEFHAADGSPVAVEVNALPVTLEDGTTGVQGVARDITARKQREAELRLKTEAIDAAETGVVITDPTKPDNPIVYANDGFESVTGYPPEHAIGQNCRYLQGPLTAEEPVATLREAVAAGESATVELVNYRKDGSPFWNELTITPVTDGDGPPSQYIGFQRDVTTRKRRERVRAVLNRVLRHNLKNDLMVIQGAATTDSPQTDGLIQSATDQLLDLSAAARELHRLAKRDPTPRQLDPTALFDRATAQADGDATVSLDVRTNRQLCAGDEMDEAVTELVENAATHDPGRETTVELTARDDGDDIVVTVTDDGPGIESMEADVVNGAAETQLTHGTGLGLWLVNWIVTRYGGSFTLTTRDGESSGTVATLRLPAIDAGECVEEVARKPVVLAA